ncbi:ArsR family transcriptional regulator [Halostagnicola sp. A56]|uniref:helix-turn-helix domain-containing protein n=1 Tax=Halostagnicola sp. A56 TaxID=1495067 RepID=UPI0004A19312|nr:helix-turn-helix domain-containing protein [Halostagnicola sp. A56]KDE59238.1 ArsR family transcriptional regulator [Halostagnicola sp. A56]
MSTSTADEQATATEEPLTETEYRERLRDLPPSAKLVAKVLETDSPLSQGQLAEESLLPDRTVRYALNRLEDVDLVESRYSFRDARKQVYSLNH